MAEREPERDTVLFVSALAYLGGAQVSLASIVEALDPAVRVVVAAPAHGPFVERIRASGRVAEHVVIPQRGETSVVRVRTGTAAVLARWLWRNRQRLRSVHANGDSELKLLLPLLPLITTPVVVWFHRAELAPTTTRLWPLWQALARRLVWAAVSRTRERELLDARVGTERNTVVVANPIDPASVVPERRIESPRFVVGYLGNEYAAKGFLLLPDIAEQVRDLPVTLLVVAKGNQRMSPEVQRALERLRAMPDVVTFRPRSFDVRTIFAELDAVLVPSYAESFCRVAAEGMLNGLPVIGSDLPAVRELVEHGAGLLFAPGDADGAARRVRALAANPALAAQLGSEGRRRAEAFSPDRIAEQLVALYDLALPVDVTGLRRET
jgi:glycosyltransferase involved in cell wall biosynthesis